MSNLLLIESPGKVKKLGQILGAGWVIKASMGHIRELANDGEDALGFDLGVTAIECRYQPRDARSKKVLSELRQAVKQADRVYIATTPTAKAKRLAGTCSRRYGCATHSAWSTARLPLRQCARRSLGPATWMSISLPQAGRVTASISWWATKVAAMWSGR